MPDEPETLFALAETQLGLFTCSQADDFGVRESTRRTMLRNGAAHHIHKTVYRFAGHPITPEVPHLASVLAAGPTARSSHRASAWLWSMTPHEQRPEITTTKERARIKGVRTHVRKTPLLAPVTRCGVPVSTAAETLLDLGSVVTLGTVQLALDRGIANRVVTPMDALDELQRRGGIGVRGTAALRQLLDTAGLTGSHPPSVLEAKTRRLIRKAGLPQPQCELIVGERGQYRLDFCWPDLQLAVEVDGWLYHSSQAAFTRNKSRKNHLTVAGFAILEYSWAHITKSPNDVVAEIRTAYEARVRVTSGQFPSLSDAK